MTGFVLFIFVLGFGLMLWLTRNDLRYLRRRIDELEEQIGGGDVVSTLTRPVEVEPEFAAPRPPARVAAKVRRTATVTGAAPPAPEPPTEPEPRPSPFADLSFESLVGGKLPIWVGGIALVFAGFFLVRYTIEAGLFGPGARSVVATIFALAMIAMSELGGRIPKVGASFAADPRLGQSLAGAGVATLYGTLYMAAEIYGLIGVGTAFTLVLVVTAIAFALSLRHGPPTALMGLIGGFAAPWVAGMGASNLPTLLLYLAVFIAALFGLAVWRRWLWLLVLASGGGLLWSLAMLATANSNLGLLGGFIAATGGGAILALGRFEETPKPWGDLARYAPMALAFVQLALLLPKMDYSATGWLFYFALSGLAIVLAWRDSRLLPLVGGALLLAAGPLYGAWTEHGASSFNITASFTVAALFATTGLAHARLIDAASKYWAAIGLAAAPMVWFVALSSDTGGVADRTWALTALLAAAPGLWAAWEWYRRTISSAVQPMATAAGALMLWMGCVTGFESEHAASYNAAIALAVAAWAKVTGGKTERDLALFPLAAAMLAGLALSYQFIEAIGESLGGERVLYRFLPQIGDAVRSTLLPALLILAICWQPLFATARRTRMAALALGGAGLVAMLWLVAKVPAGIETPADFIRLGFVERAVFTQALFAMAWLGFRQGHARSWPTLAIAGWVLTGIALFRIFWFDLFLLNPVLVPQMVGPIPVANLLTAHLALTAFWLWIFARETPPRFILSVQVLSLGSMILTVLATIRQAVQGNLVSGGFIDIGENYLYSAGLLALALAWLVIGIKNGTKLLRVAGLSLLTVVTLKVFLIDAAALTGLLRIFSFLGLGIALIGIGWAYGRVMAAGRE